MTPRWLLLLKQSTEHRLGIDAQTRVRMLSVMRGRVIVHGASLTSEVRVLALQRRSSSLPSGSSLLERTVAIIPKDSNYEADSEAVSVSSYESALEQGEFDRNPLVEGQTGES